MSKKMTLLEQEYINDAIRSGTAGKIKPDIIITTDDTVKLSLIEYHDKIIAKQSWATPLGIDVSLLAAISTSEFKEFLGISPYVYKALFILLAIGCTIWLLFSLIKVFSYFWKYRNIKDIDWFLNSLRKNKPEDKAVPPISG